MKRGGSSSRRWARLLVPAALALLGSVGAVSAQDISISLGEGTTLTERAVQLIGLITILSLAPSILIMMTSFTRIVVVLSLLRSAIGLPTAPPNSVMVSLALFLTAFIMAPTLEAAYRQGVEPVIAGTLPLEQGIEQASQPFRVFMLAHTRESDLALFIDLADQPQPDTPDEISLRILIPAFMISELRRAFEIGFLMYLPFIIIDMVVSSILMAMGMMMLPPAVVSLPFKLIFFVLVDGWALIAGSLVRSYIGTG